MWGTVVTVIIKYWVEFLLGLVVMGGGIFLKRYAKLEKEERQRSQNSHFQQLTEKIQEENKIMIDSLKQEHEEINNRSDARYNEITEKVAKAMVDARKESKEDDAVLQAQISKATSDLDALRAGLLSMQGKEFRNACKKLLDENHEITLDEWEEIEMDHDAYNGLGGNHKGDYLFGLVQKKVEKDLLK